MQLHKYLYMIYFHFLYFTLIFDSTMFIISVVHSTYVYHPPTPVHTVEQFFNSANRG